MVEVTVNKQDRKFIEAHFFSALLDETTGESVLEQEVIFVLYFNLNYIDRDKVQVQIEFLELCDVKH